MMAGKARPFQDHRVVDLIMSSCDPRTHKRIGRGERNFDSVTGDRVWKDAVLAGTFARFTQNPTMNSSF